MLKKNKNGNETKQVSYLPLLLDVKGVSSLLSMSTDTIRELIKNNKLFAKRIGGNNRYLVHFEEVKRYADTFLNSDE